MSVDAGDLSVSLNGVDNVGKTTQLAWLRRGVPGAHLVGSVDAWDARWREVAAEDFGRWWFVDSSTAEHVGLMVDSHVSRRAASGRLALEDRGWPMVQAACAATAAVKEGLSPRTALRLVGRMTADLPGAAPRREVHVLLRRFGDPAREAVEALRREPVGAGGRYAAYQHALAEVLSLQVEAGDYHAVLDISDAPILEVQRRLRGQLADLGVEVQPLPDDDVLDRLWVLGGMSESGKSTVGELLRDEHGVTRLKIGYLLEIAALRAGVTDPYASWAEPEQAERLTEEVLRFAATTKPARISLESAHRFESTAHLQRVWGDRCRVVYVEAGPTARASRAAETATSLRARDSTKRDRGADRIAHVADYVIDNSGPLGALKLAVNRMASADVPRAAPDARDPVTHSGWLRHAADHVVDDEVVLVLATGSTGSPGWRDGWSDLDLLVVRDTAPAVWLRGVAGTLPASDGVKVGLSVFTTADLETLRVPPRVVQSLRRAGHGAGVLYRRADYLLPVPDYAHGDRTSRGELGLVLMTTRRLLGLDPPDPRALHKHLVLLAKIVLRADGHEVHDAEDVLAAFRKRHPAAGCVPPALEAIVRRPRDPALGRQLVDAADRLLTYLDRLDGTVRTARASA